MPHEPILALDLGTQMGWALRDRDNQIISGTISFKPGRFEGGGMRFLRFTHWMNEIWALSGSIGAIYFEEVRRHAGTDAAHCYGGFLGVLTSWAENRQAPYAGVPVGEIKRYATGKGNASKDAMVDAMRGLGFSVSDDNEADALALLMLAIEREEKRALV